MIIFHKHCLVFVYSVCLNSYFLYFLNLTYKVLIFLIHSKVLMGKNDYKKSVEELLKEEQDNLLAEINEKAKRRKKLMNPDTNYGNVHEFENKS